MRRSKNILLSLVLTFAAVSLYAGDEDMSPSAYHVFDPETGFMMTVDPTDEEQQGAMPSEADNAEIEAAATVDSRLWIIAILVVGGIIFWAQKKRASRR
jgi:hypothetical protein